MADLGFEKGWSLDGGQSPPGHEVAHGNEAKAHPRGNAVSGCADELTQPMLRNSQLHPPFGSSETPPLNRTAVLLRTLDI